MNKYDKWLRLERILCDYHRAYFKENKKENEHILFLLDAMQILDKEEREFWLKERNR